MLVCNDMIDRHEESFCVKNLNACQISIEDF